MTTYTVNLMISQAFFFILVCIISNVFTLKHREFFDECLSSPILDLFFCVLKAKVDIAKEDKFISSIFKNS